MIIASLNPFPKMKKIGYARVSTLDQDLELQLKALSEAGCEVIFKESGQSGTKRSRPELEKCLKSLSSGDVLMVWKLDRLARSLPHLMELAEDFEGRGVNLKSLTEPVDTTTAQGKLIFQIMGAFAEFERNLIRERTMAGLQVAKARGRVGGRIPVPPDKVEAVNQLIEAGYGVLKACDAVGVSKSAYYRYLHQNQTL